MSRRKGSPRGQGPFPQCRLECGCVRAGSAFLLEGKEVPAAAATGTQLSSNELENSFPLILIILEGS